MFSTSSVCLVLDFTAYGGVASLRSVNNGGGLPYRMRCCYEKEEVEMRFGQSEVTERQ